MKYWDDFVKASKEVFSQWQYVVIAVVMAVLLFVGNAVFRNYKLLMEVFSFELLWSLVVGTKDSFPLFSLANLILISLLGGIVLAFSIFLVKRQIKTSLSAGGTSVLIAILAPACPSCALGVFGVIGMGGLVSVLPFGGLELGVIGTLVLIVSVIYLSVKIETRVCRLRPGKKTRKKAATKSRKVKKKRKK